ncbi:hypothetical protein Hanom_Chr04g00304841 [Helianthus anomalus]
MCLSTQKSQEEDALKCVKKAGRRREEVCQSSGNLITVFKLLLI